MPWLVDGSNVLGAARLDRYSDDAKRELVRLLAAFARSRKTRVSCIFDGDEPPSFAKHLGSVTVAFSGRRPADDVIIERAAHGRGWTVVTSDVQLAQRVSRREVNVLASSAFLRQLEQAEAGEGTHSSDWEHYFSDPSNRHKF